MIYIVRECPTGFAHLSKETVYDSLDKAKKYASDLANTHGVDISIKIYEAVNEYTLKRTLVAQW